MHLGAALLLFIFLSTNQLAESIRYEPNWKSLDSRPLPSWYDQSKIGIFIHWGVFSVPAFKGPWLWWFWKGQPEKDYVTYMKENYKPDFTYADFAPQFSAKFYNATKWANILKRSGARYVVLVSKHHEGYTNWPSKHSWNWNSKDVGPNRDLVAYEVTEQLKEYIFGGQYGQEGFDQTGELAEAIRNNTEMHFGLYHSLYEFFNPLYLKDKKSGYTTQDFVRLKTMPELYELIYNYKPEVVWSDGDWEAPAAYWNSTEFLAWLYNDSPVKDTVVTNDRWGSGTACKHGGFYNCHDKYNPGVLQKHKWENAMTLDKSWGARTDIDYEDVKSMDELLDSVASTISCGGNILINIAPTQFGTIIPIFQERLLQLGDWLKVNGEAIYSSVPWTHQNDTVTKNIWYTSKVENSATSVYAIMSDWPDTEVQFGAPQPTDSTTVSLLGYEGTFSWKHGPEGGMIVLIPPISINNLPCQWSWVFKLEGLSS